MRHHRLKALATVGIAASLVLALAAWSRPSAVSARHEVAPAKNSSTSGAFTPFSLGWIAAWWNSGSCHGYPDVQEIYVLYGDSATGAITSWVDIGQTSGTDSCSGGHGTDPFESTGFSTCSSYSANHAGCVMYDGYVQGNSAPPNADATWTPDDGICDGCWHFTLAKAALVSPADLRLRASGANELSLLSFDHANHRTSR
jgi:hypothetical protein